MSTTDTDAAQLKFRDPTAARALGAAIEKVTREIGRDPVSVMHVCGSHEQAIARFGLRAAFPPALDVIMGPGCPVCITDVPEVDEGVALARQGVRVATYGDMLRVPGSAGSLADARAAGAKVDIVYGVSQAVELARQTDEEVVFFATGFETTAVATAAEILRGPPKNFSVLSAHKYIPPVMEIVAEMPGSRVEGFLAAGHAATITGSAVFEPFVERHRLPVVVAGFEPLDILAGLLRLVELIRDGTPRVENLYPRCVTPGGEPRRAGAAVEGVPPAGGPLARHRPRPERKPPAPGCVGARGRPPTLRHRREGALGLRRPVAGPAVHLRRDHVREAVAHLVQALRQGVPARDAGGGVHGLQRGHLPDLAPVRRTSPAP